MNDETFRIGCIDVDAGMISDPHPPGIDPSFYRGDGPPQIPQSSEPDGPRMRHWNFNLHIVLPWDDRIGRHEAPGSNIRRALPAEFGECRKIKRR